MNEHVLRVEGALIVLERVDRQRLHVVSTDLPAGTADEAVRHRLGKLDYRTTLPSLAVLTLASLLAKSSGRATLLHLVLPGSAIRNAVGVSPYGGQYLDLGPVRVADRHR